MKNAQELNELRFKVIEMCLNFLKQYMEEERAKKDKKIVAQKFLAKCGYLKGKSRPQLKLRFEILKRDDFKCVYCGRGANDVILEIDHINPVSFGGLSNIENLVTSCKDCNLGKKDFLLNERQEEKLILQNKEKTNGI